MEGEPWQVPAKPPVVAPAAERTQPAAGSARPTAGAFLTRAEANRRQDAELEAFAKAMHQERLAWMRRVNELERRVGELEAKA